MNSPTLLTRLQKVSVPCTAPRLRRLPKNRCLVASSSLRSPTPLKNDLQSRGPTIVTITYADLLNGIKISPAIRQAYGPGGLGILTVQGVPGYATRRARLLSLAPILAGLPQAELLSCMDKDSKYSVGWSHGVEELVSGRLDTGKGSFYANPMYDEVPDVPSELRGKHPAYFQPNKWPAKLPQLEPAFKDLGRLMVDVGLLLAKQCDEYVTEQCPTYRRGLLCEVLKASKIPKGRLLHYFQLDSLSNAGSQASVDDSWCGLHNDHGSLTALTKAIFFNQNGEQVQCPDPNAGLYIIVDGQPVHVQIPDDHIAYQVGEATQVLSGGVLRATPHFVQAARGPACKGITRNTFAVFLQPNVDVVMDAPAGIRLEDVAVGEWQPGQTFGKFSERTFHKYYPSQG